MQFTSICNLLGLNNNQGEYVTKSMQYLPFSAPDLDMSPFSSAYLSGRNRESDANRFLGAVSKLLILWAKYVYWYLSFTGVAATLQT